MLYQRSLDIERRLETVLALIRKESYSTPKIAEALGVSIPTISRDVTALRQRGYNIQAERGEDGWRYLLRETRANAHARRSLPESTPSSKASEAKRR